jgi:hypothetical protein
MDTGTLDDKYEQRNESILTKVRKWTNHYLYVGIADLFCSIFNITGLYVWVKANKTTTIRKNTLCCCYWPISIIFRRIRSWINNNYDKYSITSSTFMTISQETGTNIFMFVWRLWTIYTQKTPSISVQYKEKSIKFHDFILYVTDQS